MNNFIKRTLVKLVYKIYMSIYNIGMIGVSCPYCFKKKSCSQLRGKKCKYKSCRFEKQRMNPEELFGYIYFDEKKELGADELRQIKNGIKIRCVGFNQIFKNVKMDSLSDSLTYLSLLKDRVLNAKVSGKEIFLIKDCYDRIENLLNKMIGQRCHLCNQKMATTREHDFKNGLLNKFHSKETGIKLHIKNGITKEYINNSSLIKGKDKNLCEHCNGQMSVNADINFEKMIVDVYSNLEKDRNVHGFQNNMEFISKLSNSYGIVDSDSIMGLIYSFSKREELDVKNFSYDEVEVKRYFSKYISCQLPKGKVPREIQEMFFNKKMLDKMDIKIFNLHNDFSGYETVLYKSHVLCNFNKKNNKIEGVFFEFSLGPLIVHINWNMDSLMGNEYYKLYLENKKLIRDWEKAIKLKIKK